MKYQGIYFNHDLAKKLTLTEFRLRFQHLWPGLSQKDRHDRLTECYALLKKIKNANR